MKIYFAGSIRGGRQDAVLYQQIIKELGTYGKVLTEHVGDTNLSAVGDDGPNDQFIHDRDMEWLLNANLVVAEVTITSMGVGYEIGRAVEHNIPVLCLFRPQKDNYLSAMIAGNKDIDVKEYQTFEEAKAILNQFFTEKIS